MEADPRGRGPHLRLRVSNRAGEAGGADYPPAGWLQQVPSHLVPSSPPRDARNMAKDVQNTFYDIVAEFGPMEHAQAVDYVKKLMTKGRYSLDVWS